MTSPTSSNRCVLITNGNVLSMLALGGWIAKYGASLAKVYVTTRLPSERSRTRGVLRMLARSGWSYTYFKLWVNLLAPRRLRRMGLPASVGEFIRLCGYDTPVEPVSTVNDPAVIGEIAQLAPAWLVSFSATERFKQPLISTPTRAAINTHWGALPAYAGLSPYFWHLMHNEPTFGVTLHRIDLQLDAGPVIEQLTEDMSGVRTALEVALRMTACVSPMLCRLFDGKTSLANLRGQDHTQRTYFRHPTRAQMRQFRVAEFRMQSRDSRQMLLDRVKGLAEPRQATKA